MTITESMIEAAAARSRRPDTHWKQDGRLAAMDTITDRTAGMVDLKKRVDQFAALELPGQPRMMHMGTSYLVNDLWREIERLRAANNCPNLGLATTRELLDELRARIEMHALGGLDYRTVDGESFALADSRSLIGS